MSTATPASDADLLEMLRPRGSMSVSEMADALDVTPTAVRQRLGRLMAEGLLEREAVRAGRGRPKHRYHLSAKGLRVTGSNFTDLAVALWREIGAIEDAGLRRTLLRRVVHSMARAYARQIEGHSTGDRMRSLSELLRQRKVQFSVQDSGGSPTLTAHSCPYPVLADEDRAICDLEGMLFSELLKQQVVLAECRLDGGSCCQFQPT